LKNSIDESTRTAKELLESRSQQDNETRVVIEQKVAVESELREAIGQLNRLKSDMTEMKLKMDDYDCQLKETQEGESVERETLMSKMREIREEVFFFYALAADLVE
jgi:hypothetical protein